MIKSIFFDFAGVLTVEGRILHKFFFEENKDYFSYDEFCRRYDLAEVGKLNFSSLVKGIPKSKLDNYLVNVRLQPSLAECLEDLYKRYVLFMASNHVPGLFERELDRAGIVGYFDKIFVSYKLGVSKPDKEFFSRILKITKVNAIECVFVDDAKINLINFKKLGGTTIWLDNNKSDYRNKVGYIPDFTIHSIKELCSLLCSF